MTQYLALSDTVRSMGKCYFFSYLLLILPGPPYTFLSLQCSQARQLDFTQFSHFAQPIILILLEVLGMYLPVIIIEFIYLIKTRITTFKNSVVLNIKVIAAKQKGRKIITDVYNHF